MDDPVTVREVMNRSYLGVSEADPIAGAAELMREEGVRGAAVLRGSDPVGVLDEGRLCSLVADGLDPAETTAGELMQPAVSVDADQHLEHAISAMATDDLRHLLVEENGEVVGSVSDHDIVTAYSVLGSRPEPPEAPVAASAGSGGEFETDLDREVYSTQGVCESCGSLTRELSSHNGQLLCADCLGL